MRKEQVIGRQKLDDASDAITGVTTPLGVFESADGFIQEFLSHRLKIIPDRWRRPRRNLSRRNSMRSNVITIHFFFIYFYRPAEVRDNYRKLTPLSVHSERASTPQEQHKYISFVKSPSPPSSLSSRF